MKEELFKDLSENDIEIILDELNIYGLELLEKVIYAWQYNCNDNSKVLKEAYKNVLSYKEEQKDRTFYSDRKLLRKSLQGMTHRELKFLEELLSINPKEVINNKSHLEDYSYEKISKFVDEERKNRINNNPFNKRFNKSMSLKNTGLSIKPYSN